VGAELGDGLIEVVGMSSSVLLYADLRLLRPVGLALLLPLLVLV